MQLSEKYLDFIKHDADVEFLEGTTYAGKTTVGVVKFMFKVAASPKKLHVMSALDLGVIEKNLINKDLGLLEVFGNRIQYNASGRGQHSLAHIEFGDKIIYCLGYENKTRWKKALGGQYGCVYIDEINIADMEYVREVSMRCDYLMGTLNPDDPNLPVYKEYINRSRPVAKWKDDTPEQILEMLTEPVKPRWTHWFFSFKDNLGATKEKIAQVVGMLAPGTKIYKNKVLGLRGRHTGLVFNLNEERTVVPYDWVKERMRLEYRGEDAIKLRAWSVGVDTSYSRKSDDKIAFVAQGITLDGRLIKLAVQVMNNTSIIAEGREALAPSDIPPLLDKFVKHWQEELGLLVDCVYIDSADAATNSEALKYKRKQGLIYSIVPSYKKIKIIDRITTENGWMAEAQNAVIIVRDFCQPHIDELNVYSWLEDKQEPEDKNDHTINASQYGWMPYKAWIGKGMGI